MRPDGVEIVYVLSDEYINYFLKVTERVVLNDEVYEKLVKRATKSTEIEKRECWCPNCFRLRAVKQLFDCSDGVYN